MSETKKASLYEERLNLNSGYAFLFCEYRKREGLSLSDAASASSDAPPRSGQFKFKIS